MTTFKGNRRYPNPVTVTEDPRSHTLALQQIIEALNTGQRRTKDIQNSFVRLHELVDVGLIEIVNGQLKLTNTGAAVAAGGATALADLTDVDLTGLANGDVLIYNSGTGNWEPGTTGAGAIDGSDMYAASLNDLADVSFYMPDNGDVLTYNSDLGIWECHPLSDQFEISSFFSRRPHASQLMFQYVAAESMYFPANFSGAYGAIGTNPAATQTLTIARDGTTIGTISISTGGVFTFATTSGQEKSIFAGEKITVTNQSTADTTGADIAFTLVGIIQS